MNEKKKWILNNRVLWCHDWNVHWPQASNKKNANRSYKKNNVVKSANKKKSYNEKVFMTILIFLSRCKRQFFFITRTFFFLQVLVNVLPGKLDGRNCHKRKMSTYLCNQAYWDSSWHANFYYLTTSKYIYLAISLTQLFSILVM